MNASGNKSDSLTSSSLRRLIRGARGHERLPKSRVTADSIFEAYQERRGRRRDRIWQGGIAVAVCLSLGYLGVSVDRVVDRRSSGESMDLMAYSTAAQAVSPTISPTTHAAISEGSASSSGSPALAPIKLEAVAQALELEPSIEPLEPYARIPEVVGARAIRLSQGTYRIGLPQGESGLRVHTSGGELELAAGVMTVAVAGDRVDVVVESGSAYWVRGDEKVSVTADKGGAETPSGEAPEQGADPKVASAAQLAALAEESLGRGRRSVAICHLRQLVSRHPRSTEAGRGLLDLGRLLRAEGDSDGARCAYQLYLDRYPRGGMVAEVERARDRLGEGPQCRGLRPRT